ncbi:MAG: PDDEXK nuclease domain-containing protein [Euryarchaeota archaeon]|nr:PDDEXK nuclease domain-containing protein [Euryarchaeota archaeon]
MTPDSRNNREKENNRENSPNNNNSNNNARNSTLFDRVASIIEQARANTVRAVNSNMVLCYWFIGREIVEEVQEGKRRAEYGKQTLEELSDNLIRQYGKGFSKANLRLFRQFYLTYPDRMADYPEQNYYKNNLTTSSKSSPTPPSKNSDGDAKTKTIKSDEFVTQWVANSKIPLKNNKLENNRLNTGFNPQLGWSHYRALIRVKKTEARLFYEQEAAECTWDKRTLERHIHSQYYERMLRSQHPEEMRKSGCEIATSTAIAIDSLKDPYILEFLDLPETSLLHESHLETAIITHLRSFLMELGKGFAFVGRQKRMRFDETDLYVDLVFYNSILKCYLLIDLKMGEISYKDVGQMDGYVRMFDDLYIAKDDNPTIGLILCTDKNDAVARYSVLNERKQIFASKYMLYLPTEEELAAEILRERRMIEERLSEDEE